jgi:hypothetical protein
MRPITNDATPQTKRPNHYLTDALGPVGTARAAGCTGTIVVRMDSAFYGAAVIGAIRRAGAHFSVTARMDPKIRAAIASIGQDAWTPIKYPQALWDDQLGC